MSNEFILVVSWKPTNRNDGDRLTKRQFGQYLAQVKVGPTQDWEVCKNLEEMKWIFSLEPHPVDSSHFCVSSFQNICWVSRFDLTSAIEQISEWGDILSIKFCKDLELVFTSTDQIFARRAGQIVWSSSQMPRVKMLTGCVNYSRLVTRAGHFLYFVIEEKSTLCRLYLHSLADSIDDGHGQIVTLTDIGTRVQDFDVDPSRPHRVFYLTDEGEVYINKRWLFLSKFERGHFVCLAVSKRHILLCLTLPSMANRFELRYRCGRFCDQKSITIFDRARMHAAAQTDCPAWSDAGRGCQSEERRRHTGHEPMEAHGGVHQTSRVCR